MLNVGDKILCKKDYTIGADNKSLFLKGNRYEVYKVLNNKPTRYKYFLVYCEIGIRYMLNNEEVSEYFYTLEQERKFKVEKIQDNGRYNI